MMPLGRTPGKRVLEGIKLGGENCLIPTVEIFYKIEKVVQMSSSDEEGELPDAGGPSLHHTALDQDSRKVSSTSLQFGLRCQSTFFCRIPIH
jgi:hypothetical protein